MKFASIVCSLLLVVCAFGYRLYTQPLQIAVAGQRYELAVHLKGQAVAVGNVAPIGTLIGAQSLTTEQIDAVLIECNSPAKSTGADWIAAGNQYGIDAAYAVAFFYHESTCGSNPAWAGIKPDGTTTHNVGNIICAGYTTCFGRFRDYPDWQAGINDWFRLISVEYVQQRGLTTVAGIIPVYAPSVENDVDAYVRAVNKLVTEWRARTITTASDKRSLLVAYATSLVGIPYIRGGRSASGGDCSGTMQHVYLTVAGIDIGATTFSQFPALKPIELAQVQEADLWYGQYSNDQHTGMIADVDGDGKWDLINNGGLQDTMHIDFSFLDNHYFSDHTMGFRTVLQ